MIGFMRAYDIESKVKKEPLHLHIFCVLRTDSGIAN